MRVHTWNDPGILCIPVLRLVSTEFKKNMATHVSPDQRAKILSVINDEGMSIIDAAKTFLVTEDIIKKWMRKQLKNGHTSSTEVQRLKQENQELKTIIGEMALRQKKKKSLKSIG